MGKKFSAEEQKYIRQKLITIFERQLHKERPSKITIDDLVQEAGIAKGSFYHFFPTKEMLFVTLINQTQDKMVKKAQRMTSNKDITEKEKLKKILLLIIKELKVHPWLQNLSGPEFEKTIRRLPPELQKDLQKKDKLAIKDLLQDLRLTAAVPLEDLLIIIEIILSSASRSSDFGRHYDRAVKIMINCLVDGLFSERKIHE